MFKWLKKFVPSVQAPNMRGGAIYEDDSSITGSARNESEALKRQGNAYLVANKLEEAAACYRRAIELNLQFAEAYSNLGMVLEAQGNLQEAEASIRQAIQIMPSLVEAHNNLGGILDVQGRLDEAEACYRRAIGIKPDYFEARGNLLFSLNYTSKSALVCMEEARHYGQVVSEAVKEKLSFWQCAYRPERLRVGFVSGDLRNHPVGHFLEGVLANVDPATLELFAYPTSQETDELTERIQPYFAAWKPLYSLNDEAAANMIHADGIHVLMDLSGHTAHTRLPVFAWKPAPIQVSWLGYFATTGVAEMDYFIADPYTLPESEEINFTEKIWRLPRTRLCFTAPPVEVPVSDLPALTNGYVTFACFNNLSKMNDVVVELWARVLAAVPGSRLFLKNAQLKGLWVQESVRKRFAVHGVGSERLIMEGFSPRADYLAAYNRVDIALDPFPFTGGTTSAESLWMGVPVLTLGGERFVSRQGVGLLMNAGLNEWISADEDDYVARAVLHASDLASLAKLRSGLRRQVLSSPIFDASRFAHDFASALCGMWGLWCEQNSMAENQ